MIVVGVDPATTYAAVAVFDTETKDILGIYALIAGGTDANKRIRQISEEFDLILDSYLEHMPLVCIEGTHMVNINANTTFQQGVGAFVGRVPLHIEIRHPHNTSVKMTVGGTGKATKEQVAAGVLKYFASNKVSATLVQELIDNEDFDETDALAIGITGYGQS